MLNLLAPRLEKGRLVETGPLFAGLVEAMVGFERVSLHFQLVVLVVTLLHTVVAILLAKHGVH